MVPPFTDYFANTPNPVDSFLSGIGSGQAIQANMVNARNVEEARQQLALKHEADVEAVKQKSILEQQMFEQKIIADQAAAEKAAAIEEEKKSLGKKVGLGTANGEEAFRLAEISNPESFKQGQALAAQMDKERQQRFYSTIGIASAQLMQNQDPENIIKNLEESATALEASSGTVKNATEDAKLYRIMAGLVKINPKTANQQLMHILAVLPGGGDVLKNLSELSDAEQKAKLAAGELTKQELEIQAAQSKANLTPAPNLSSTAEAAATKATTQSITDLGFSSRFDSLLTKLSGTKGLTGFAGTIAEFIKKNAGLQDSLSGVIAEYKNIVNSDLLSQLPPGAASDRDVALVREGYPGPEAPLTVLIPFIRGLKTIKEYSAKNNQAIADWTYQNGSLGPSNYDIVMNGKTVPKGTNFLSWKDKNIPFGSTATTSSAGGASATAPNPPAKGSVTSKYIVTVDGVDYDLGSKEKYDTYMKSVGK